MFFSGFPGMGGGMPGGMPGGFPGGMGGMGGGDDSGDSDGGSGGVDTQKFYDLLGVEKTASQREITKAYRKKAMKLHPDRHPNEREKYQEKFQELQAAYEVLNDPDKRKLYDRYGEDGLKGQSQSSMGDLFDMFFSGGRGGRRGGGGGQRVRKSPPIRIPLDVTLEDLYIGASKPLKYKRFVLCRRCDGKGGSKVVECSNCDGQGVEIVVQRMGYMTIQQQGKCRKCDGEGKIIRESDKCRVCNGKRLREDHKEIEVHLPIGSKHAEQVVLRGQGHETPNAANGDLVCIIRCEKHDRFQRIGADLLMEYDLSLKEALCGFDLRIPHLSGHILRIQSKPGETVQHHDFRVVYSWGMPQKGAHNVKGHLYLKFNLKLPSTEELGEAALQELARILPEQKRDEDGDQEMRDRNKRKKEKEKQRRKKQKKKQKQQPDQEEEEEESDEEPLELHEHAEVVEGEPNVTPASAKSAYDEDEEQGDGVRCRTM